MGLSPPLARPCLRISACSTARGPHVQLHLAAQVVFIQPCRGDEPLPVHDSPLAEQDSILLLSDLRDILLVELDDFLAPCHVPALQGQRYILVFNVHISLSLVI